MEIVNNPQSYQKTALDWRREGLTSAVVPTMGAFHEGHRTLIREGRRLADRLSVTLFVNPIQFAPGEDLDRYPRQLDADVQACRDLGVDVLFTPPKDAMYPQGFQTHVAVERMTQALCGAARPGHFQGVTTVVLKLLMLAQPSWAVFGWKDAQQFLVIRRMVRDLNIPVALAAVETVREADGLAMSSRNAYLTPEQRADAPLIYRGLESARRAFEDGERRTVAMVDRVRESIARSPHIEIEYIEARSMETLDPLDEVVGGDTLLAVAARLVDTRLIDNIRL